MVDSHLREGASFASYCILFLVIFSCMYTDWKFRKIFNVVTMPGIVLGLLLGLAAGFPKVFLNRLLGFGLGFSVFLLMFYFGYMGGGDVKLVGAIGALTGYPFIIDAIFFGILSGGVYAIIVLIYKKKLWQNLKSVFHFIFSFIIPWKQTLPLKSEDSLKIPYGLCISMGTLFTLILHRVTSIKCFFLGY